MSKALDIAVNDDIRQKLAFQRGVLTLLKDTDLFGPMIEKALKDLDEIIEQIC